mmetsp:Transcript_16412/g.62243  ORF Transcript_16412/g.62243 Transcript_16412/m.62243 type:complete len:229 (-) Transcript_16412:427-1113(-)
MVSTAATPSSSALCASMGPSMTSPMAHTPGTLVRSSWSTGMRPRRSVSMPTFSRPRPWVKGRRPVATRTTSVSMTLCSPPAAGSTVRRTPSSVTSEETTLVPMRKVMPCFSRLLRKALESSLSRDGTARSRNSTTSTSAPRRRQTEPISRPITPAPMTTIFLGTEGSMRAPVLSTMRCLSLSTGTGGSGVGSDPVAMRMFLAERVSEPPAVRATSTDEGLAILPWPLT